MGIEKLRGGMGIKKHDGGTTAFCHGGGGGVDGILVPIGTLFRR